MAIVDRDLLLNGTDLKEKTVFIKAFEGEVVVKPLSAAYASEAEGDSYAMTSDDEGNQIARVDKKKMEVLQVLHGLVEPKLSSTIEAEQFLKRWGPGGREVIQAIDDASLIDKEAIAETASKFPASEASEGTDGADALDGPGSVSPEPSDSES